MSGCAGAQSALDPAGPQAGRIGWLWWLMLYTLTAVFVVVMSFLLVAAFRPRGAFRGETEVTPDTQPDPGRERRMSRTVIGGVVATVVILFVLLVSSFLTGRRLYSTAQAEGALVVKVTGHQWWWEVEYEDPLPSRTLTTANEIHIPTGRPVLFKLKSNDVIHSFWVPNLHGKTDLVPGHETKTWLRADRAGTYRGQCAEFCGHQHAHMAFMVVAETPEQFGTWYEAQLQPGAEPSTPAQARGREVFLSSPCIMCHRIQGTDAGGTVGPDLTHVASRPTIAAGTLENTRGHLAGWVLDSQKIKPGNHMPPNPLEPEDLQALLDYLQSLK
ncbi:MAG: cytochrome c oxidase subunit II [Acidobacteriota bacterium]|nr:cytochrome c oxidase subunit II [Acidobacteriota bacterium]